MSKDALQIPVWACLAEISTVKDTVDNLRSLGMSVEGNISRDGFVKVKDRDQCCYNALARDGKGPCIVICHNTERVTWKLPENKKEVPVAIGESESDKSRGQHDDADVRGVSRLVRPASRLPARQDVAW